MPSVLWKLTVLAMVVAICSGGHDLVLAQPAAAPVAGGGEGAAPAANGEDSPFLVEPKTAEEFFNTAVISLRLSRPNLARRYLEGMMALDPDDDTLLQLRDKHGPAVFLKFANQPELQPLSTQLLERVNTAFRQRGADPSRIDALIADLRGTPAQREVATITLRSAGAVVVPRMVKLLATGDPQISQELLIETLLRMGPRAVPPLLGVLESDNVDLKATVIQLLGVLGNRETANHLWYAAFAPDQAPGEQLAARAALERIFKATPQTVENTRPQNAAAELRRVALQLFRSQYEWKKNEDGDVEWWNWSPNDNTVAMTTMPPDAASLYLGSRFARQALAMNPEQPEAQSLFLSLALATDAYRVGWDRPVPTGPGTAHDVALTAGEDVVASALLESVGSGNPRAAIAALSVLSQIATKHQLTKPGAKNSPITVALNYPDPRVQYAAAVTALQLEPEKPFPGSERVVSILARALNDSGQRHSLVVHASVEKASTMAGLLGELGYAPRIAQTGRDAFRMATEEADVELIVLDINTIRWDLSLTVANLRADVRTAATPIALWGPADRRAEVARLMSRYPLMTYLADSHTSENIKLQLDLFVLNIQTPPISPEMRAEQTASAAFWLAHIAEGGRKKIFNLPLAEKALLQAVNDPNIGENVLRALGGIASVAAQAQLQESACGAQQPAALREAAAIQLAFHIQRHGLLLTPDQVFAVEKAWKEATEPEVSTALAAVVGTLKPNSRRVSGRLKEFEPMPISPPAADETSEAP